MLSGILVNFLKIGYKEPETSESMLFYIKYRAGLIKALGG